MVPIHSLAEEILNDVLVLARSVRTSARAKGDRKSTRLNSSHSLHGALPICHGRVAVLVDGPHPLLGRGDFERRVGIGEKRQDFGARERRSEEHTSELQSLPTRRSSDLPRPCCSPGRWSPSTPWPRRF